MPGPKPHIRRAGSTELIPPRRIKQWYTLAIETDGLSVLEVTVLTNIATHYKTRMATALSYRIWAAAGRR